MDILLVEDDPQIAAAVRRGLDAEGFIVTHTADGRDGLQLARTRLYHAIILDVMLPGLHGDVLCSRLRASGLDTPVLMLTAKGGTHDEAMALDTGADDYLRKPFSYAVLLARLRALIRRSGAPADDGMLRAGDLWLDTAGRRCGRDEQQIELTGQEFAVLHCLIRTPGQVLSKSQILDDAWDMAYTGGTSIVEVYVSMLRRKIDQPFGRRSLRTVRGAGYRLDAVDA